MRARSLLLPGLVAVVVAVIALALKPSLPSPSASASKAGPSTVLKGKTVALKISNYAYQPPKLTVKAGSKIVVTNKDATAHTVTGRTGGFDSGTVNPGKSKSFTITKPGTYTFYCQFHAFMSGTITVVK
jgi:plastocyanin